MIDFDELEEVQSGQLGERAGQAGAADDGGWERRALHKVMMAPSAATEHTAPAEGRYDPSRQQRQHGKIEVAVRHGLLDIEMKVVLPEHARFKHIKLALAKQLDSDEILRSGQLMRRVQGRYVPYRDNTRIGDVREVVVVRTDLARNLGVATLSDVDVSSEEEEAEAEPPAPRSAGRFTGSAAAATTAPARPMRRAVPKARPGAGRLTRPQALRLQGEIYAGFSAPAFQERLAVLVAARGDGALSEGAFVKQRQELCLTVQGEVLPRYGFEGTQVGVYKMMGELGIFVKDPQFVQLATKINRLIGVNSPPETWGSLSKTCQGLRLHEPRPGDRPGTVAQLRAAVADLLPREPWPSADKGPPYTLSIAGSWLDFKAASMEWQRGLFMFVVTIGSGGSENFQLLKSGSWDQTIYPSLPDATLFDSHLICGPDKGGHGKNWQIGKGYPDARDHASPGAECGIVAVLDKGGSVTAVVWQMLLQPGGG